MDTHPWFGLVDHLDALIPNLEDASRPLASLHPTSHLVHSLEKPYYQVLDLFGTIVWR